MRSSSDAASRDTAVTCSGGYPKAASTVGVPVQRRPESFIRVPASRKPTLQKLNPLSGRLGQSSSDVPPSAAELARTDLRLIGKFQRVDQHALTKVHAAYERECLPRDSTPSAVTSSWGSV